MLVDIQSTFATEFEVPERVSLASDGRAVTLALSTQTLAAKQYLRVTPRLEKFAIIMAETARPDGVWLRQVICNCSRTAATWAPPGGTFSKASGPNSRSAATNS
ncbi:DUF4139 domain-containing protein [Massilia sp. B-10]|nr:DUF4139 domain-containing protein [Massilia sp. B-10]